MVKGSDAALDGFRQDAKGETIPPREDGRFVVLGHFVELLTYFLPEARDQYDLRYAGRLREAVDGVHLASGVAGKAPGEQLVRILSCATPLRRAARVFEDGVEQKITSFSSETVNGTQPEGEQRSASQRAAPVPAPYAAIRRTFVICIDSLPTAVENLAGVRDALAKLFRTEQQGDSQYVLFAVGSSSAILQNTTSDPALLLKAIESRDFQRQFLESRRGSNDNEMRAFRRSLDETRALCDAHDPSCPARKNMLPTEAEPIAAQDRVYTIIFLSFRTLSRNCRTRRTGARSY